MIRLIIFVLQKTKVIKKMKKSTIARKVGPAFVWQIIVNIIIMIAGKEWLMEKTMIT